LLEVWRRGEEAAVRCERQHTGITTAFHVGCVEVLVKQVIGLAISLVIDWDGINIHSILIGSLISIHHQSQLRLLIAPRIFDDGGANIGLLSVDVGDDRL
jgi:hypothetical protein